MSFASFLGGTSLMTTYTFALQTLQPIGPLRKIPCYYQLSILTFRYILPLWLSDARQIVHGGETFCCFHLFLLRDLTNSLTPGAGGWLKISGVRSSHCSVGSCQRLPEVSGGLRSHYLKDETGVRMIELVKFLLLYIHILLTWIY